MIALRKIWRGFLSLEHITLFIMCMLLVLLIFSSVLMRYVFKINYIGIDDLSTLTGYWIYFVGAACCSYEQSHISADLATVLWKEGKSKQIFLLIRSIVTAVLFLIATYCSFDLIVYAFEAGTTTISLKIPLQYMYAPICTGFVLMSIYQCYHVVMNILDIRGIRIENEVE